MPRSTTASPLQDDRFLLVTALGRGGMARVYRAFDRVEQRVVALKVHSESRPAGPAHPLSAEFELWARMRHPNIVEALDLGISRKGPIAGGTPYLVLEHVDGRPVDRCIRPGRTEPLTLERLSVQLLLALHHVHAEGVVHRDVKPANILVETRADGRQTVKLTDFGLATLAGEADEPGRVSGSLPYLAPEALLGQPLDCRADLYALGIVLYKLATGGFPVPFDRVEDVLRWHLGGSPADPRRKRPRFPPRLAHFVRRLTMRDRETRPADAGVALAMLDAEPSAGVTQPPAAEDRATRAKLRLALDATRLGARRVFAVAASRDRTGALSRQIRVWSQVFGLGFHDLGSNGCGDLAWLSRLVLRQTLESGAQGEALLRRHRLDRVLPLSRVAGVRMPDESRRATSPGSEAVVRICRFLLDSSELRGTVLFFHPRPHHGALVRAIAESLCCRLGRPHPPRPGRGGLLLVRATAQDCHWAR